MKIIDKLKNALFEEEYVEVEEKPKAPKKEKPIVKKMVLPEEKKVKPKKREEAVFEEDIKEEPPKKEFKFPAVSENDFIDLTEKEEPKKDFEPLKEKPKQKPKIEIKENQPYSYKEENKRKESAPYGVKDPGIKIENYGSYEKKIEKKGFQPSPIISPIYGLIDENTVKEENDTKKEIRITSSYKSRRLDVDRVREKAYGNNDDIFEEELSNNKEKQENLNEIHENEEDDDVLLDIMDTSPQVSKVTVGDAEEYFEDLGLEYNVDYKDVSHARKTGRRVNIDYEDENEEENLFDLIESKYKEKEGE